MKRGGDGSDRGRVGGGRAPWPLRLYRALLLALPRGFRRAHGAAMEDAFQALAAEAVRAGRGALLRLFARETADLLRTAAVLRLRPLLLAAAAAARLRPSAMLDDLRLAARSTLRHPGFFALASLTLALGIAATTAMYGAFRAVVLEPVPFPEPERLVVPSKTMGNEGAMISFSRGELEALRGLPHLFERVEAFATGLATLTGGEQAERLAVVRMTPGLPELLGTGPLLGRTFHPEEVEGEGASVLLLSHETWRTRFGGRADVLGRTLTLDGASWTIVGVMPPRALHPEGRGERVDLWLPLTSRVQIALPLARLAAGVTAELAARELDAFARGGGGAPTAGEPPPPSASRTFGATVLPILQPGPLHEPLRVLMIAVSLLLLVACVNVSNLLLHRTSERSGELAVRAALGGSRARLVRQIAFEGLILASAGALAGSALAWGALETLGALRPDALAALDGVRIDGALLLFSVGLAFSTTLLFGLVPAVRGTRPRATAGLRTRRDGGGQRGARARWALVASEVALSFALLVGAALATGTLRQLAQRDPGYRAEGLFGVDVRLPAWRYAEAEARAAAFQEMLEASRALPGVTSAALANGVPPRMPGRFGRVRLNDAPRDENPTSFEGGEIDPGFLATIGQPVVAGRGFTADDAGSPLRPVLLAEGTARALFPGADPVGQRIALEGEALRTVVGVVQDIRPSGLAEALPRPLAYWPIERPGTRMTLVVRADAAPPGLATELERVVRRVEPDAVVEVAAVRDLLGASLARERFTSGLLASFALLALVLASVGLYGVLSQVVAGRTQEIGVRMALGATATRTAAHVLRAGLGAVAAGLVLGALLAAPGLALLRSRVFGLPGDPLSAYLAAAAAVLALGAAATFLPARRAARLDPVRAMRAE